MTLIGVVPNDPHFTHPADRRRYLPYFRKRDFEYEFADFNKPYPAVYISISADLGLWSGYREVRRMAGDSPRVVFDLSDDLLSDTWARDTLRGLLYYLTRRTSTLDLSYKRAIVRMIENSDVVLCGSDEQKAALDRLHPNVVVMRDFFLDDLSVHKTSWQLRRPGELNVLWEGLSHGNGPIFEMLRQVLESVKGFTVNAHVVTDPTYCRVAGSYVCEPTSQLLARIFKGSSVRVHYYSWTAQTFSAIAAACDMAVIPVPQDPIMRRKPENKLLLLWQAGLPVVTSDTPSYARVMRAVKQNFAASSLADWGAMIGELAGDQSTRERYMVAANEYLARTCSESAIMRVWETVFP